MSPRWVLLAACMAGLASACPGCRTMVQQYQAPLPRVLPDTPSLEQVLRAVNGNSEQILSFYCPRASLSGEGFPTLRAVVAFQRPNLFRLRAETALTGPELDVGSNDQAFWVWIRRNVPQTMYFCRHELWEDSPARQNFPLEPQWLAEAMGVARLDPRLPLQGPFPLPGDRMEIRNIQDTKWGPRTKVTVLDSIRGCVLQQSVYDARGQLLATAELSQHRRDPLTGLVMPGTVTIHSIPAQLLARIDLGPIEINRPRSNSGGYWMLPEYPGSAVVDLSDPRLGVPQMPPAAAAPGNFVPPAGNPYPNGVPAAGFGPGMAGPAVSGR